MSSRSDDVHAENLADVRPGGPRDRARGVVLGAACGDALGAPLRGSCGITDAELVGWTRSARVLRYTADTALLVALGEQVIASGCAAPLNEQGVAVALAETWECEPWRGYDPAVARIFQRVIAGQHWAAAARGAPSPDATGGGGSAAWVAPVALTGIDLGGIADSARTSARPTQVGRVEQEAAVVQALAVALALRGSPEVPMAVHEFLERIAVQVEAAALDHVLIEIRHLTRRATPADVAARFSSTGPVVRALAVALISFLHCPDSYADAVEFALRVGGDTDTIAAMTGAIAGARHGANGIPVAWLARLENLPRLCQLADDLAAAGPGHGPVTERPYR